MQSLKGGAPNDISDSNAVRKANAEMISEIEKLKAQLQEKEQSAVKELERSSRSTTHQDGASSVALTEVSMYQPPRPIAFRQHGVREAWGSSLDSIEGPPVELMVSRHHRSRTSHGRLTPMTNSSQEATIQLAQQALATIQQQQHQQHEQHQQQHQHQQQLLAVIQHRQKHSAVCALM